MQMIRKTNSAHAHGYHTLTPVGNQSLIAAGGAGNDVLSNRCELYEISTDQWKALPNLNIARAYHSGCCVGEKTLYIFAGFGEDDEINEIEWLDLQDVQ